MSDDIYKATQKILETAQAQKIPEHIQKLVEESLAKSKEANAQAAKLMQSAAKNLESVHETANSSMKNINEKVLKNIATNSQSIFELADAIIRTSNPVEAMRLQSEFLKTQLALVAEQTQEIYELSADGAKESVGSLQAAGKQNADQ